MLALERPFASYMACQVRELVHNGDRRPKIDNEWDDCIQDFLKKNWSAEWKDRYTMKQVTEILRAYTVRLRTGNHASLFRSKYTFKEGSRKFSSTDYDDSTSGGHSNDEHEQAC
jgi:hypothetical protein